MPRDNSFRDYIVEDILGHIEGITSRAMFSGYGIYLNGIIVGLIIDGEFYLKTDKNTKGRILMDGTRHDSAESGKIFEYERRGKTVSLPYAIVPIEILEDREKIEERIYESFEISKKAKK